MESNGLQHGDLSPCSVSLSGRLLDYLHINKLVEIAQGKQSLIYDAPDSRNPDVWALGICYLETIYSIEKASDGYEFLTKLNLNCLSDSARFKAV